MAKKRELPNMDNMTPDALLSEIRKAREQASDAKFYEGVYKQRLVTMREGDFVRGESLLGTYKRVVQERIDTDAVKAAFPREELIEKGFLKVTEFDQLDITAVPERSPIG